MGGVLRVRRAPLIGLFILVVCGLGAVYAAQPLSAKVAEPNNLRIYVVVLDGLNPAEVSDELTPALGRLRREGTWYEQARAVFPAETLPNHASMMTGVEPQRHGVIGNDYWFATSSGAFRFKSDTPDLLDVPTLTTTLEQSCAISTATILSKAYLYSLFRGEPFSPTIPVGAIAQRQADYHWNPTQATGFIPYPDEHALDYATWNQGVYPWLDSAPATPQFAFINLGDIDRAGHADPEGPFAPHGLSPFRRAAVTDSDTLLGQFVDRLKSTGAWDESVLLVVSDHNMDWSIPDQTFTDVGVRSINVTAELSRDSLDPSAPYYSPDYTGKPGTSDPGSSGDFATVPGGGSAAVWAEDDEDIGPMARRLAAHPAVELVATRPAIPGFPTMAEMGMDHPRNGDLVVFVKPGYAVRDSRQENPLPGNHGHPATQQSVLLVSGGHPIVRHDGARIGGSRVYDPAGGIPFSRPAEGPGNVSIAPTVSAILGLDPPPSGYDAPPLTSAFEPWALKGHADCRAARPPREKTRGG